MLIIGRQFCLSTKEIIDLLALDREGKAVIIEIKRDMGARDAIAQALDYESLVAKISEEDLSDKALAYFETRNEDYETLREAFEEKFDNKDAAINSSRRILIVAPKLDLSTERMINYLASEYNMDINGVTFNYYHSESGREFLVRNITLSKAEREQIISPSYPLEYHITKAKPEFTKTIQSIFDFFKKNGFNLHSTKNYVTIQRDETDLGWITPRKTIAHLNLNADFYMKEDIEKLEKVAKEDSDFEVRYSDQITKNGEPITQAIVINNISGFGKIKKYQDIIIKAIDSTLVYEENYEKLDKLRKQKQ